MGKSQYTSTEQEIEEDFRDKQPQDASQFRDFKWGTRQREGFDLVPENAKSANALEYIHIVHK